MGSLFGGSKPTPAPYVPPPAPQPVAVQEESKKKVRQGASGRTQTVFTSPLGASDSANVQGKKDQLGA